MNTINNIRAKLLYEKFGSNSAYSFNEMVNKIMELPSFTETKCCDGAVKNYPLIKLNSNTFNGDFTNLEQAIEDNFPEESQCSKCKKSPQLKRTFQPHILIEVILLLLLFIKIRFYPIFFFYLDAFLYTTTKRRHWTGFIDG